MDPAGPPLHPDTVAVHAGRPNRPGEPLNEPVTFASVLRAPGGRSPEYTREGNPTWAAFETAIGALEGGAALAFASGIAAIAAVVATVPVGGTVIAPADAYSGTRALLGDLDDDGRVRAVLVESSDTDAVVIACREAADAPGTLLWLESPTNPLLAVPDLAACAEAAHAAGAVVAVDSTFATPLLQRPLEHGADVVVHSATKLISGHSDVLLGVAITRDEGLHARLDNHRHHHGAVPGPMEAFLALRGLRTLPLRLERAQANAAALAAQLAAHPAVTEVRYPGLADHPQADRVARQLRGGGAMIAFTLAGGAAAADAVVEAARLIVHATSLGGVETSMERRARWGGEAHLDPGLIRLSVGCEAVADLWADLEQALAAGT